MSNSTGLRSWLGLLWANVTYWWHTPKRCHKCWARMKRVPLSMSAYKCVRCGNGRQHSEYVTYSIELRRNDA